MWNSTGKKTERPCDDEHFTFLGKGASFKGIANFDGTVRIDGRFEGELHAKGDLIVGEQAIIKGIVTAGTVIASGRLNATITGTHKVQLLKTAIMIGDIRTPSFSMEEGAHFHGMCEMGADRWVEDEAGGPPAHENVHDLSAHREKLRT